MDSHPGPEQLLLAHAMQDVMGSVIHQNSPTLASRRGVLWMADGQGIFRLRPRCFFSDAHLLHLREWTIRPSGLGLDYHLAKSRPRLPPRDSFDGKQSKQLLIRYDVLSLSKDG
jgi:hypothetical protein